MGCGQNNSEKSVNEICEHTRLRKLVETNSQVNRGLIEHNSV